MQRNRKRYALLVAVIFLAAALLPATALGSTPPQSSTGPSIAGGVSDLSVTVTPPTEPGTPATIHISVTGEPSTGLSMGWAVGALRPADGYTVIPVRDGSGSFTTGNLDESTWVWITVVDASGIPYPNAI